MLPLALLFHKSPIAFVLLLYKNRMPDYDLSQIPAAPPPPGVIPNFIDPPSQANLPRIFTYVTLPPMILFLAMRMYVRIFVTRKIGLDDCEFRETSFGEVIPAHKLLKTSACLVPLVNRCNETETTRCRAELMVYGTRLPL